MLQRENFDAYGVDFSAEAVELAHKMFLRWNIPPKDGRLSVQDMCALNFENETFDAVIDVFSTFCLTETGWETCRNEICRVLKKGGKYFSYTPSKASDAFLHPAPSTCLDESTLNGILRKDSPFCGNNYPFRFMDEGDVDKFLQKDFALDYFERVGRTYRFGKEYFEFLVFEATKK